ncbi:unnamed protein product [Pleuronectes platessa]|uniref:Uncharacterized protein n=1 Tax=Pleuronectes platessa TaxID=8262 RepID=A0A9N7TQ90_PLEPL|nr:unnamed protein product [Pleuronectes platessa]
MGEDKAGGWGGDTHCMYLWLWRASLERPIKRLFHSSTPLLKRVAVWKIKCTDHRRPALGSRPTAVSIAARVMQGVRGAGMERGTGLEEMEVNGEEC